MRSSFRQELNDILEVLPTAISLQLGAFGVCLTLYNLINGNLPAFALLAFFTVLCFKYFRQSFNKNIAQIAIDPTETHMKI